MAGVLSEDNSTIRMSVVATDYGQPTLNSSAEIVLTIQPHDADVPTFASSLYEIEVNEHRPIGKFITVIP